MLWDCYVTELDLRIGAQAYHTQNNHNTVDNITLKT